MDTLTREFGGRQVRFRPDLPVAPAARTAEALADGPVSDLSVTIAVLDLIDACVVREDRATLHDAYVDPNVKGEDVGALYGWLVGEYAKRKQDAAAAERRRQKASKARQTAAKFGEVG